MQRRELLENFLLGKVDTQVLVESGQKTRQAAQEYARDNIVNDPTLASSIRDNSYTYPQFQELGLYGLTGFFEKTVDFSAASMPLMPQVLSPFFGKTISELIMLLYLNDPNRVANATFMGLGAGRGFLDHDLIDHLMSVKINPEWEEEVRQLKEECDFLVTDRTLRSQSMLSEELEDVVGEYDLKGRLKIMRLDATDFELKQKPFGIVYANELLDNMPIEPIINIDGQLHSVAIIPYSEGQLVSGAEDNYENALGQRFPDLKGKALRKAEAERLINSKAGGILRFKPVLVPLVNLPELNSKVQASHSIGGALGNPDYAGLYGYQVGVAPMLRNIRKAFTHGLVVLIDYFPTNNNTQNWDRSIMSVSNFSLESPTDLDFQVDFEQIREEAEKAGMMPLYSSSQVELIKTFLPLVNSLTIKDMRRWANANGHRNLPDSQLPTVFRKGYELFLPFSNYHTVVAYSF